MRMTPGCRCLPFSRGLLGAGYSSRTCGCALLEWCAFNDVHYHGGQLVLVRPALADDVTHGWLVGMGDRTTQCVGQELFGERYVEDVAALDQSLAEVIGAIQRRAVDHRAARIDRQAAVLRP